MAFETPILLSALAGLGSFLSPCILPIIPGFLSYLSSSSIKEANDENELEDAKTTDKRSIIISQKSQNKYFYKYNLFCLWIFTSLFSIGCDLNSIFATAIGNNFQQYLSYIGGIVIAAFGANLILSLKINRLNIERKFTKIPKFKTSYITSFVFGLAFAAGWTPCVGPILGSTFTLAATNPGTAYNLLLAYSLGLGIPFLITGAFFSQATE